MTNWLPDLSEGVGPLYQRLADRIESDIDAGAIPAGSKLPPQRDLAYDIGTTVGTVGRAYALLRERGLVSGEVGRGTYVLAASEKAKALTNANPQQSGTRPLDAPAGKLRFDTTVAPDVGQGSIIAGLLAEIAQRQPLDVSSYTHATPDDWFTAGSVWLERNGFRPQPDTIVPTQGTHAGAVASIVALTNPGDYVAFEPVTYSQVARSTALAGRRIALVNMDDEGLDPDHFDHVCAQKHPAMMFLMPAAHNPTCVRMSGERRERIAELARKHNVILIEDDLYGRLSGDTTPLLAEYAPERTIVASGLSKSVAAGVRGGWLSCPPAYRHRIRVAHRLLSGGSPFILPALAAHLVHSGEAHGIEARSIAEIRKRVELVRTALAGHSFNSQDNLPFIWLSLPEAWNSGTFKNAAFERGILLDDEDEFKAGRCEQVFHRVRLSISQPSAQADVSRGLAAIRQLLEEGRAGYERFD
ncbi:MAG: PLP-dependent aminotransferase family protein [Rhizobiaceae bacterium]|nr:PLP-dependent aminotransferase family protein [Rhizobiaceae bacterium]